MTDKSIYYEDLEWDAVPGGDSTGSIIETIDYFAIKGCEIVYWICWVLLSWCVIVASIALSWL